MIKKIKMSDLRKLKKMGEILIIKNSGELLMIRNIKSNKIEFWEVIQKDPVYF